MKSTLIANVVSGVAAAVIYAIIALAGDGDFTAGLVLRAIGIGLVAFLISFVIGRVILARSSRE